ncbi:hypothetical protein M2451_000171 [Dysgonomonas sp. PFB1-18]|uniref:outer membrane protein n=1 Tax=unclassified Dysgonomonas TaxID=2630389 RepID=UPI0024751664|nr:MULTISPECIES: outer membrane beta-barrel protein [unclassified Dysgonomonas]MDH6307722.1 hypothetical protein [Dysgonomonas sp. PF1-14]MDH6337640.1 hypothetical protein [Dysgonomonas sp. PF1-16]MDH6378864.1 hypothetical protein [Dysgonomonas sp. PFB1-18]MDH6396499.1 hypothetical protein [Dysgonomonas sp. PF1-23]
MKTRILFLLTVIISMPVVAQEGHKLNTGIDLSFGAHYFDSNRGNPLAAGVSVGYEYDFIFFFGVEAGFRFGGFNQKINFTDLNWGLDPLGNNSLGGEDIYRGTYLAPYIAPKIYLPIGYDEKKDRPRFIYLENRFSYTRMNLDLDKITDMQGSAHKWHFQYEIRAGYQFPVNDRWAINCWLGYNTFDFSKVKPESIKFKNTTPIQLGIGFNYILKQ